jgi:hypothetical protein
MQILIVAALIILFVLPSLADSTAKVETGGAA